MEDLSGSIWLAVVTAASIIVASVILWRRSQDTKVSSVASPKAANGKAENNDKKNRVGRCPFTAETDFIVETADNLPPTPWDLFAEWMECPDIPADTAATTMQSTSKQYLPFAARWLNAGISGQDTPGHLRTGLKRLKDQKWFLVEDPGDRFVHELGLKRKNLDDASRCAYVQEKNSISAQLEVLELFCHYLPKRYPHYYEFKDDADQGGPRIIVKPLQQTFLLSEYKDKPLQLCARIVQEDLVLLRPPRPGHDASSAFHMTAAAVVFSFSGLEEKLGKPIEFIHAPVPGFEKQLRKTMDLFFRKLLKIEQPLWRNNWVVTPESGGKLDEPNYGTEEADATRQLQDTESSPPTRDALDRMFLKVEYQTIRRLPRSGNLLFTIKMMVDRLPELEKVPAAAACLAKSIRGMSPAMRAYKGIGNGQDATYEAILQYLDNIGGRDTVNKP
jgi:hypothetical protein